MARWGGSIYNIELGRSHPMARHDDDLDFLGGDGPSPGERIAGAVQIVLGMVIFMASFVVMFYETDKGLESHNMHTFLANFGVVLFIGVPIFAGGIWLFKRGMRAWKGQQTE